MEQTTHPPVPADVIRRLAREAGFDRAGVTPAQPLGREQFLRDWLARGHGGSMAYLARYTDKRNDPRLMLAGARCVICLAAEHGRLGADERKPIPPGCGYIARYARGIDYHVVLKQQAFQLVRLIRREVGRPFDAMVCVDTKPVLEKELAARAGLGWIGKNTLLNHPQAGSYSLLAEIIVTLDITPDEPMADHCGRCRRCIDACPTGAIVAPGQLDVSRCIGCLTIETREVIAEEYRPMIGRRLFGCDACQSVCPFNNREAPRPGGDQFCRTGGEVSCDAQRELPDHLDLRAVARWTQDDYARAVAGTAAERATLSMWRRNAVVAIGNGADPADAELLRELAGDPDMIVAQHARWAAARLGVSESIGGENFGVRRL